MGSDCPYSWISPAARARAEMTDDGQQENREPESGGQENGGSEDQVNAESAEMETTYGDVDDRGAEDGEMEDGEVSESESVASDASTHTVVNDSFSWADESDLDSDAMAEALPLASALPAGARDAPPPSSPTSETPQSSTGAWSSMIASVARLSPAMAELIASANWRPVVMPQQVLPVSQHPDDSQQSSNVPSSGVLDSQGLIKPQAPVVVPPPDDDPTVLPQSSGASSDPPRHAGRSRRTPVPIPEPLAAAGACKPTAPSPVTSSGPRKTEAPMESVNADLKRKASNGSATVVDKKKRSTKKGT